MPYAKKSLGQNFLKSKAALAAIVEAAKIEKGEQVLEIGPGRGALTEALLEAGATVTAIEKDDKLFELLQEKFSLPIELGKLRLIHGDILEIDLPTLRVGNYKLVANIPYYITGQIFRQFLETKNQPKSIVVLVQKEVADRIVAKDGKESILSLSVKAFGEPKFIKKVPAAAFSPKPKVDSAILAIGNIGRDKLRGIDDSAFFDLVKKGFAQKRKVLRNNLKDHLPALETCQINPNSRAEDLKLEDWLCLAKNI